MINFDNAATTYPKPPQVKTALAAALEKYGGNPGRGGHTLSMETAKAVYAAREKCAGFFGAEPENTVFTENCTHALNLAIHGKMYGGGHMVISCLEHNSVSRPAFALKQKGVKCSVAEVYPDDQATVESFRKLMTPDTKAVVCTLASNVTGQILPIREIGRLCQQKGICFIVDGAQGCGAIPINLKDDGIHFLCTAGHKGLYGPPGTGLLLSDGQYSLKPIMQGGTGTTSLQLEQPEEWPEILESGTINTCGAIALGAGVGYVSNLGPKRIFDHEDMLCRQLIQGLSSLPGITIYREPGAKYAPIVSFTLEGVPPIELGGLLNTRGFCLRGGIHCAALAHKHLGTDPEGTLRFSPSIFNTRSEVAGLINAIAKIAKEARI